MDKEIVLQIFTGGFRGRSATFENVRRKLDYLTSRIKISKVIMGWSLNPELYKDTQKYLSQRGIEFYFWTPVFSEIDVLKECIPLIDYQGKGIENYTWHEQEDFTFYCCNHPQNSFNFLRVFEENFSSIGFTGVFLDKIRYPSFANGLQGVFTCFCPHCQIKYKSAGFDPMDLEGLISKLKQESSPFGITKYYQGKYSFENDVWNKFFNLKSQFISDAVKRIAYYFVEKQYKIGLDVMSPFVSQFVGQDIKTLSSFSDFVKPMMYRMTNAPAGLPFELEHLLQKIGSNESQRNAFYRILDFDPLKHPFDIDFAVKELEGLAQTTQSPIYPGLEINRIKDIAEVSPSYIEETIEAYGQVGVKGFVLSWNLLDAPEENVDQIVRMFS